MYDNQWNAGTVRKLCETLRHVHSPPTISGLTTATPLITQNVGLLIVEVRHPIDY